MNGKQSEKDKKNAKLAEELRKNLLKRKQQSKTINENSNNTNKENK